MSENEVRERILCEATSLFARKGYGSTTVREVVEAAGVTKPSLYYWFENKEALFLEAVRHQMAMLNGVVEGAVKADGPVTDRIGAFVRGYLEGAQKHADGVKLLITVTHPSPNEPQVDVMSVHRRNFESLVGLVIEGQQNGEIHAVLDPKDVVFALLGITNMYVKALLFGDPLPGDYEERIMRIFLRGVAA